MPTPALQHLPREVARQIDQICDEYEKQRRQGLQPDLASLLARVPLEAKEILRTELAAIEVECCRSAGEKVQPEELAARFHVSADFLNSWLQALENSPKTATVIKFPAKDPGLTNTRPSPNQGGMDNNLDLPCLFGDYELLERLGQGGMGTVYRARHLRLDREMALKVVRAGAGGADTLARFEREMRAIGRLDHANIVEAHHAGEHQGRLFLVMKLLDGLDLARVVQRAGPLRVADACEMVRQAALGLQCIHEQGLVHRDIKPSNLMLVKRGPLSGVKDQSPATPLTPILKILDLGLARLVANPEKDAALTQQGVVMGTIDYMAPEQQRNPGGVTIAADIYSLGCVFYELLAGQPPFSHWRDVMDKLMAHRQEPPPDLRRCRPDLPENLVRAIERMLAKEASQRFATPGEIAAELTSWSGEANLIDLLYAAEKAGVPPKNCRVLPATQRLAKPRWRLAAALGVVVIGLLIFLGKAGWFSQEQPENPSLPSPHQPALVPVPLIIKLLDVEHFAKKSSFAEPKGKVGLQSFATRFDDQVRVKAELSQSAYFFLLAFNPNGQVQLCWPEDGDKPPHQLTFLEYPVFPQAFNLNDEVKGGLQAFTLVASRQPLPSYAAWSGAQPPLPWKRLPAPAGVIWRGDGTRLDPVLEKADLRGTVTELAGIGPLVEVTRRLRSAQGIDDLAVVAFPVRPKTDN